MPYLIIFSLALFLFMAYEQILRTMKRVNWIKAAGLVLLLLAGMGLALRILIPLSTAAKVVVP